MLDVRRTIGRGFFVILEVSIRPDNAVKYNSITYLWYNLKRGISRMPRAGTVTTGMYDTISKSK